MRFVIGCSTNMKKIPRRNYLLAWHDLRKKRIAVYYSWKCIKGMIVCILLWLSIKIANYLTIPSRGSPPLVCDLVMIIMWLCWLPWVCMHDYMESESVIFDKMSQTKLFLINPVTCKIQIYLPFLENIRRLKF